MLPRTWAVVSFFTSLTVPRSLPAQTLPPTRQDNVVQTFHGVSVVEPYKWLEDAASSETRKWLAAEDSYARRLLDVRPERAQIETAIGKLLRHDRIGFPLLRGYDYFF